MTVLFADYAEERELFRSLLVPEPSKRILLFRGQSGTGKTALLSACWEEAQSMRDSLTCVPVDLKGSLGVTEVFSRLARRVGREHLPQFAERVAGRQRAFDVNISDIRQRGTQNQIQVFLSTQDPSERGERRAALTDALFGDLETWGKPLLLLMDTYEAGTTEVKEWIGGALLGRVAMSEQVRVLLAGQEVPDADNIEWRSCCKKWDLCGVNEARYWIPVVEAMQRKIEVPDPLSWLAGVCHAHKGRPKDIIQAIESLPSLGAES